MNTKDSFSTITKSTWEYVYPFESFPRSHQTHYAWTLRGKWKDEESLVPWNQNRVIIYSLEDPHPGYSSFEKQLIMLYHLKGQWKSR